MKLINQTLHALAASTLIATGFFSAPAVADQEVVAVIATQTQLADNAKVFKLDTNRDALAEHFSSELKVDLGDRLADEFESAQRSTEIANDFSAQILDALDERLPVEVGNHIAAAN